MQCTPWAKFVSLLKNYGSDDLETIYNTMLPIVLLGVYRITRGRGTLLLSGAVGCSLLWNWYTGAINCLFACFWLVLELALHESERKRPRQSAKRWLLTGLRFGLSMSPLMRKFRNIAYARLG